MIPDIENTKQKEFYTEPRPVIIAIDYDGTLVTEKEYNNPNYVPKSTALMNTLIDLKKKYGNKLYYILWTCRYKEDGSLKEGMPIIEATSGNTGISFSALGRLYNHDVHIFMPDWVSSERINIMKLYGAKVYLVSKEDGGFKECIRKWQNNHYR